MQIIFAAVAVSTASTRIEFAPGVSTMLHPLARDRGAGGVNADCASRSSRGEGGPHRLHAEESFATDFKGRYSSRGSFVPEPFPGKSQSPHKPRQGYQIVSIGVRNHAPKRSSRSGAGAGRTWGFPK